MDFQRNRNFTVCFPVNSKHRIFTPMTCLCLMFSPQMYSEKYLFISKYWEIQGNLDICLIKEMYFFIFYRLQFIKNKIVKSETLEKLTEYQDKLGYKDVILVLIKPRTAKWWFKAGCQSDRTMNAQSCETNFCWNFHSQAKVFLQQCSLKRQKPKTQGFRERSV